MAPAIRLEFIWDSPQPLTMAFECQLFGTDLRLVQQIDCGLRGDWLIFNAAPSKWSTEGLDNVAAHFAHLGIEGQQLVSTIRQILGANTPQEFCLHLDSISADTRSCLPALLPYVFGVHRLPSLDLPAWSTYYPLTLEQAPHKLINADVPHPMTPFNCEDVLHSIRQLQVELWESSRVASVEQELSLRNLVDVLHKGFLFKIGRMVVMAVKWNDYQQLAGSIRCRVPDRLRTQITWTDSTTGTDFHCTALRSTVPVDVPVAHDALFVITKGVNALLRDACKDVDDVEVGPAAEVKLEPKFSRFSLESNLMTACSLESSNTSRWQQMLLNQNLVHDEVDLATTRAEGHTQVDPRQVEVEWDKICRWRVWNREQRRALQSIRRSAGGISLITGPAGTGKTLVQQALCAFLWRLGLHVLVLAPANSNCNDFIEKMNKSCPDVDGLRVFASSTELDLKDVVPLQRPTSPSTPDLGVLEDGAPLQQPTSPASPTEGSEDYASDSGTLFDFELLCAELGASNDPHASGRNFGVQAKVLKAAREGGIKLFRRLRETNGKQFGVPVDFWSKLREYMHACAEGSFDWSNESDVHFYKQVYEGCKAQIIARSRMIVTTTGNVMSMDIQDNWAQGLFNISCKGVVIILDEACKDKEIDTLAALMCPALRNKITGMVMVGDERQLEPTNVSAKGAVQFNPFNDRLGIPLLSRLKRQGFGCVELLEQHRMVGFLKPREAADFVLTSEQSHHIADFPFRVFYANGMRSSASTYVTLRNKLPGLHACLAKICESHLPSTFCSYHPALQDLCIRTKYVQVAGRRDNSTRSAVVREHIVAFFERIYWHLHAYFQEKTQQNVMIICAYKGAVSHNIVQPLEPFH